MFEKIIESCKYVMNNSKHVKINYDKLDEFICNIEYTDLKNWILYNPYNILDMDIELVINFLLYFEAIDYSFWGSPKWCIDTEEEKKDGSDALLYCMLDYYKSDKNFDFTKISLEKFKEIVKGEPEIPLLINRYNTLVEISEIINKKMNGSFYEYIKNITSDVELFDVIVSNFNCFKDERMYEGKKIYFYKLAQLLTSDILHIREEIEKINVDYSHLIGCADYKIPQTLRALEIIEYDEELSNLVDNNIPIQISSKYEAEIRSSQIVVLDYICKKSSNAYSIDINDYLFLYSKKVKSIVKPYHKCRNTNY